MKRKIAVYMCGNFHRVLRHMPSIMPDYELSAFCANAQAHNSCTRVGTFHHVAYLYEHFNDVFGTVDVPKVMQEFSDINIAEVLYVDKSFYKKNSGDYQMRIAASMAVVMQEWCECVKPDYLLFPIIESIDAMLAYRIAKRNGIPTIHYAHARNLDCSFFSDSHTEILPSYFTEIESDDECHAAAQRFVNRFRESPSNLSYNRTSEQRGEILEDEPTPGAFKRLMNNVVLKLGDERENQMIRLGIKFQVAVERVLLPLRYQFFSLLEKYYIKPVQTLPEDYDYFPLHFAPESSINTPAPYYIDQKRVVDRILLDRRGNRPLLIKEHPAMRGGRKVRFYRELKKTPFVEFVPFSTSGIDLIESANCVYSVTGTACLEAFLLGKGWVQFGENFLSDWTARTGSHENPEPVDFVRDVLKVSGPFLLLSPSGSAANNSRLFSKENVTALCDHLLWHIAQCENQKVAVAT